MADLHVDTRVVARLGLAALFGLVLALFLASGWGSKNTVSANGGVLLLVIDEDTSDNGMQTVDFLANGKPNCGGGEVSDAPTSG